MYRQIILKRGNEMSDFSDAVKQRTAKEFMQSTKNLAQWLTRRDVITHQVIAPDTLISWVRGYVNNLECDLQYQIEQVESHKKVIQQNDVEIDRLKSIASGQPTSTILNLQESNTRFEKQVSDLTAQVLQLQIENKQLQNVNEGLHLLINKQDDAEKDKEEIAKCQAVVDAANELINYLEGK